MNKMMNSPLVSIVVATYNGEKYIKDQIESLVNQTYQNIEIIVVDDVSKDATLEILRQLEATHPLLKIVAFEENVGYVKNFERGLKLATGDLIAFSDQDDWWYPTKIEELVANIGQASLIYHDSEFVDEELANKGYNFSTGHNFLTTQDPLELSIRNCVSGHAMLFQKSLLPVDFSFPKEIPHDWYVAFVATFSGGIKFYNKTLVKYRIHTSNVIAGGGHKKQSKKVRDFNAMQRMMFFADLLPGSYEKQKGDLKLIAVSYQKNSFWFRLVRVWVFLKNKKAFFAISKRNSFKKTIYALTMFTKIR